MLSEIKNFEYIISYHDDLTINYIKINYWLNYLNYLILIILHVI